MRKEIKASRIRNSATCVHPILYIVGNDNSKDNVVIAINFIGLDKYHNKNWEIFIHGCINGCTYLCGNKWIDSRDDDSKPIDYIIKNREHFEYEFKRRGIDYHIEEVWKDYEWEEDLTENGTYIDTIKGRLRKFKEV